MSKLLTIEGLGPQEYELLEAAGWSEAKALATANADKLLVELTKANSMLKIVGEVPDKATLLAWIRRAKELAGVGAGKDTDTTAKAESAPPRSTGKSSRPAGTSRTSATATAAATSATGAGAGTGTGTGKAATGRKGQSPKQPPVELEELFPEDAALEDVGPPVNYETDPEVIEMLAVAPVAIPIPGKTLAGKGIRPSEIPVATLLNRAVGPLEVRMPGTGAGSSAEAPAAVAAAEAPKKAELPESSREYRPSEVISSSDVGFTSRRGIDVGKLRSVDDLQGEPVRRQSTGSSSMQDERVALIRAPRPETNAGRKPGSRFYIRGVLHDRPYRVWFGGLITVLLQLILPLAIASAPLLILQREDPERFSWVPGWLIAFPISLPVMGLLYIFISSGAKCRVCAQRMYVPKQCLKNRKAHHLPYFGYIGAVAMHVMLFRWYSCTFCGTAIRIKK